MPPRRAFATVRLMEREALPNPPEIPGDPSLPTYGIRRARRLTTNLDFGSAPLETFCHGAAILRAANPADGLNLLCHQLSAQWARPWRQTVRSPEKVLGSSGPATL